MIASGSSKWIFCCVWCYQRWFRCGFAVYLGLLFCILLEDTRKNLHSLCAVVKIIEWWYRNAMYAKREKERERQTKWVSQCLLVKVKKKKNCAIFMNIHIFYKEFIESKCWRKKEPNYAWSVKWNAWRIYKINSAGDGIWEKSYHVR